MNAISNLLPSTIFGYQPASTRTQAATGVASNTIATTPSFAAATLTSSNSDLPLTYNSAGLFSALQKTNANNTPSTPIQAAQNAYFAAENAVTQSLDALMSGSGANSSNTDIFGNNANSNPNDPFGLNTNPPLNSSNKAGTTATTAQNAYLATQNALTQSLDSITAKN
jgi:hypothetical protein